MIAAILRAQWLSMRFGTRGRAIAVLVGTIWYGMWVMGAAAAGLAIAAADAANLLRIYLPLGSLGVFLYWQLMPIASASMGSALDLRKLLAYPIPHAKLFTVEVLLRLTTAIEMLIVLAGGVAGRPPDPRVQAWGAVLSLPLFVGFNLLLASGTRSLFERLLARRRIREVVVLLDHAVGGAALLMSMGYEGNAPLAPGWRCRPWPCRGPRRRTRPPSSRSRSAVSLCGWIVAAGWFWGAGSSSAICATTQPRRRPPIARSRPGIAERFFRLPGVVLRDPLAGIVEKELRSLARTPRFRMVFAMGFTFGLAVVPADCHAACRRPAGG